jgi:hypothetical protein
LTNIFEAGQKLGSMRKTVQEELKHIPRGSFEQNLFRQYYAAGRMNSLGKKAQYPNSKEVVLKVCIEWIRKSYRDFEPAYDKEFFLGKKR